MKNLFSILIIASLFFNTACTQDEKVYNADELSSGSSFGDFTIKSVTPDEGEFNMVLEGEIIIKDTLNRSSIDFPGIKNTILNEKIKIGDDILDLGKVDVIYFQNPELVALYLDESRFEETPDGKTTFSGGAQIEVILTHIQINTDAPDVITAKVSNVLELNGQQNPAITEAALFRVQDIFWNRLRTRIKTLAAQETYNDGLFFHSDITEFQLYQEDESFRNFVDDLMNYGYGIEQAEGEYYLYVGEPVNYQDGEADLVPQFMTVEDLKETNNLGGLVIDEFQYSPRDVFSATFSGQFTVNGQLYYDQMWDETGFTADKESIYTKEIEVDGFTFKTMNYMKFSNEEELKSDLKDGQFEKLQSGEMIPVTMSAKAFSIEVAYDKGAFQTAEFIEFTDL